MVNVERGRECFVGLSIITSFSPFSHEKHKSRSRIRSKKAILNLIIMKYALTNRVMKKIAEQEKETVKECWTSRACVPVLLDAFCAFSRNC